MTNTNPPASTILFTYIGYAVLYVFGHLRDWLDQLHSAILGSTLFEGEFYTRRLYTRIRDCWNRPIGSVAGTWVDLVERESDDYNVSFRFTGEKKRFLNLGSYNYLGFAETHSAPNREAMSNLDQYGVSTCSASGQFGRTACHAEFESLVAEFVGKEKALVFGMGFATNSLGIPSLAGPGTLIVSDALNHTSIVIGARGSGAKVRCFKHNDTDDLEKVLRESIALGQPRTHRPWRKIIIVVEGVYSMEGEVCNLREVIHLKKKYKAYLYLDEAHSIGAMGKTGRGVVEYCGCDSADVDIMMGTFTKSFGAIGGYIAADAAIIDTIRYESSGYLHANQLAPGCVAQALTALKIIMGRDGTDIGKRKLRALHENANFVRSELEKRGFEILGSPDSPVIPIMLYNPAKIPAFSRECYDRGLATVVVGFPATSVIESRARICLSAGHTREELKWAIDMMDEAGDAIGIKYTRDKVGGGFAPREPSQIAPPAPKEMA